MESIEDLNKALVRRVYTEWWDAAGNVASVDEMVREDFIGHLDDGSVRTIDTLRDTIVMFQTGFEGLYEIVEDMIAEADRVVVRYSMFGRHSGEVFGAKRLARRSLRKGLKYSGSRMARSPSFGISAHQSTLADPEASLPELVLGHCLRSRARVAAPIARQVPGGKRSQRRREGVAFDGIPRPLPFGPVQILFRERARKHTRATARLRALAATLLRIAEF